MTPPHPCATKGPLMDNPSVPRPDIDAILNPGSIAVVGASTHPAKQGHTYVSALREFGFQGPGLPHQSEGRGGGRVHLLPLSQGRARPRGLRHLRRARAPSPSSHGGRPRGKQVKGIHLFTARWPRWPPRRDSRWKPASSGRQRSLGRG